MLRFFSSIEKSLLLSRLRNNNPIGGLIIRILAGFINYKLILIHLLFQRIIISNMHVFQILNCIIAKYMYTLREELFIFLFDLSFLFCLKVKYISNKP